jgi:uncharacterized OB-fold protein
MTWEPRPCPNITPESQRFWEAAADGDLLLRECKDCELVYHYPRSLCPDCLSDDIVWREASGKGTVYSYSATDQVAGWPDEALPHVVAYVELAEGPRIITNLVDCDLSTVEIGMPVTLRSIETEDGDIGIPVFTLE